MKNISFQNYVYTETKVHETKYTAIKEIIINALLAYNNHLNISFIYLVYSNKQA